MELSNTEIKIVVKNMAREMVKRATAKNGPRILAGEHKGHKFYFENSSYNAPSLKLYGFRSDSEIIRAIDKALLKKENATAKNADWKSASRVSGPRGIFKDEKEAQESARRQQAASDKAGYKSKWSVKKQGSEFVVWEEK